MDKKILLSEKLVEDLMKFYIEDSKIKITTNAIKMYNEYVRVLTVEAATRAILQAKNEGDSEVDVSHFEKVLAQLALDFS